MLVLLLAGCDHARAPDHHAASGVPVLRAVYRDDTHRLLVVLPDAARPVPAGDCTAPVLIDDTSGAVRQVTPAEAAQLMQRMQLSGAVHGACP